MEPRFEAPRCESRSRVYGATRRFDLATMFVISLGYAIVFGLLRAVDRSIDGLQVPTTAYVGIPLFLTWIGMAQAFLFHGQKPRLASVLAGIALLGGLQCALLAVSSRGVQIVEMATVWIITAPFTALYGYLGGALVGGVFYVADRLRTQFARTPYESDDEDEA